MAFTKKYVINAITDPETKMCVRQNIEYYITFPNNYSESNKYGIVFSIPGFGDQADSVYQLEKLCPYISDKYNYIVVGVRYHNDCRINQDSIRAI